MMVTMKTSPACLLLSAVALLLLAAVPVAAAQNIYKCTRAGQVEYTDHPCPGAHAELIHEADDSEVIDQYLRLGQDALAKRYAESHHLQALYEQRLAAHQQTREDAAQRQTDAAIAAGQRDEQAQYQAHEQALADDAANRERLRAENDALRQQNDQYRDQLAQPVYNAPPAYWGATPRYRGGHRDHDHHDGDDHDNEGYPPPSKEPVFHPCTQLAGGRVKC